jgi:hypothetical protein
LQDIDGGALGGAAAGSIAATTEVEEDVDGGPPLEVLPVGPTTATTEVEDDVDGELPRGCCRWIRQRPPLRLKRTSMAVPLIEIREHPPST